MEHKHANNREHPHATILRAIADGKEIDFRSTHLGQVGWEPCSYPSFFCLMDYGHYEFRVKPERISGWINIYDDRVTGLYDTKEAADEDCGYGVSRIACIPVEFNEGDGL